MDVISANPAVVSTVVKIRGRRKNESSGRLKVKGKGGRRKEFCIFRGSKSERDYIRGAKGGQMAFRGPNLLSLQRTAKKLATTKEGTS